MSHPLKTEQKLFDTMFDLKQHSHTRLNILTGDWILVSPHRMKRPWQGKVEDLAEDDRPAYDPACYLCSGNKRSDGSINPDYTNAFVFTNDFSSLLADTPQGEVNHNDLLMAKSESGICRVICFSPDHSLTLPLMGEEAIENVIELWQKEFKQLSANPSIKYIQIFENKGDVMGCSNPHPHGQIWASSSVPLELSKETTQQKKYFQQHGKSLLSDYLKIELEQNERIVLENEHFAALVPFWAVWPYETMILSKRHIQSIVQFDENEKKSFAAILKNLTAKYDNLFNISFPYSAGMHQAPVNDGEHNEWHWHMHFYPPLLRSATVKKFMVGYEMLANPQRDITAEMAATTLKGLSEIHYKQK
jgi:UDPglucose--hexose-1-phosphate uridylyltransferase